MINPETRRSGRHILPIIAVVALLGVTACNDKEKASTSTAIDPSTSQTTTPSGDTAMEGAAAMHDDMAGNRREGESDNVAGGPPAGAGPAAMAGPPVANTPPAATTAAAPAAMPPADAPMPMKDDM